MKYIVYMHRNKINDKKYIGITSQKPKTRWGKNGAGYSTIKFKRAILKYGWNNFEHIILFEKLTKDEAIQKEIELIKDYDSFKNGYNADAGGCIKEHSESVKQKIRDIRKLQVFKDESKEKRKETWAKKIQDGYKVSEVTKQKLRVNQINSWTPERRMRQADRMKNVQRKRWANG